MITSKLPLAALAAACVAAGGAGGYFAARGNAVATPGAAAYEGEPAPAVSESAGAVAAVGVPAAPAVPVAGQPPRPQAVQPAPSAEVRRRETPARAASAPPAERAPRVEALPSRTLPATPADVAPAHADQTYPAAPPPAAASSSEISPWEPWTEYDTVARELVVPADSVVGLRLESTVSSEHAAIEDRVDARVVRDVLVGDERAIPAGSRLIGSVTAVERGGRFKERARLGVRFHTLVLSDGTEVPVTTETIYRHGDAIGRETAAKIGGGAVAGAILGAIIGGSKGAAVGASSGAGAGTAVVMAGDRSEAVFTVGSEVTARILAPVVVTVED